MPALSQSPTPAASRTVRFLGFHTRWLIRTPIWRLRRSRKTFAAAPGTTRPVDARIRSATRCDPDGWTVRNRSAGARTFAPCGNERRLPFFPPIATEKATSEGSFIVLTVTRKAVEERSDLTRSSTRSAALLA